MSGRPMQRLGVLSQGSSWGEGAAVMKETVAAAKKRTTDRICKIDMSLFTLLRNARLQ